MALRRCLDCGTLTPTTRCGGCKRPSAHARGYNTRHRQATQQAIDAEPWCHTPNGCPYPDAGSPSNPLTGGHPRPLSAYGGDREAWEAQPRIPQCHRCNSGKRERRD